MPRCRICGCSEFDACVDALGMPCRWVEEDLCSSCAVGASLISRIPDTRGAVLL